MIHEILPILNCPEFFPPESICIQRNSGVPDFRPKKSGQYQLSRQKFLAGKNFEPYGHDAIGPENFRGNCTLRRQHPPNGGVLPTFAVIVRDFFARKFVRLKNFWREMFCAGKNV